MVESAARNGTSQQSLGHLGEAINDALATGVTTEEILTMLQTAVADQLPFPDLLSNEQENIFTDLPQGLIDLPAAARKYGCPVRRFSNWIQRGHVQVYGRLRASARGGGYLVVSESELVAHMTNPPNKGGKPRKS